MAFYLSMFSLNMFVGCVLEYTTLCKGRNKVKIYLLFTFIQMTLIAGLRATSVGWDTDSYVQYFNAVKRTNTIREALTKVYYTEPGYVIYCYLIKIIGGNAQTSLLVINAITYGLVMCFIKNYSESPVLAVATLFSFPFFYDSLSLVRNALICAMFLYAFQYIKEGNIKKYIICMLIALLFHKFALIFIPLYCIRFFKWKRCYTLILVLFATIFVYTHLLELSRFVVKTLGLSSYEPYVTGDSYWFGNAGGGFRTFIFYLIIVLFGYYLYYKHHRGNEKQDILAGYSLVLPLAAFCYTTAPMFIRVMLMLMPVAGVFITNEIKLLSNMENKRIFGMGLFTLLLAFQVFTLTVNAENYVPYVLFWKG